MPPLPPTPFQNLGQCFPCGSQAQREQGSALPSLRPTRIDPAPQGLSLVPCPQDSGPFLMKEPAPVGEQTQAVYSSFLSCVRYWVVFIST